MIKEFNYKIDKSLNELLVIYEEKMIVEIFFFFGKDVYILIVFFI